MILSEQLKRPSLHEELTTRLRELIIQDQLKPGEKVPEKDLCEAFGVSRTPLREALKVLAAEGFVTLQANRGARVAKVTRAELQETFPVIAALERLAGELACDHLDAAGLAEVEAQHVAMVAAYQAQDRAAYFEANQAIHQAILAAAGNGVLSEQHRRLDARIRRARFMVNLSQARWAQAIAEHEEIIALLRARDGAALGAALHQHMMNKCAAYLGALDAA